MRHIDFERILKTTNKSCWSEVTLENDILHSRMEGVKDHEMEDRNFLTDNHVTRVQRLETIFIEYFELEVFGFIDPTVSGISRLLYTPVHTKHSSHDLLLLSTSLGYHMVPPLANYCICLPFSLIVVTFFRSIVYPHLPTSSRVSVVYPHHPPSLVQSGTKRAVHV